MRRWKLTTANNDIWDGIYRVNVAKDETGAKSYTYTKFQDFSLPERMYLNPIPQDERDKDVNLEQNPGYN